MYSIQKYIVCQVYFFVDSFQMRSMLNGQIGPHLVSATRHVVLESNIVLEYVGEQLAVPEEYQNSALEPI